MRRCSYLLLTADAEPSGAVKEYGDRLATALVKHSPDFSFTHYDFTDRGLTDAGRYEDAWGLAGVREHHRR